MYESNYCKLLLFITTFYTWLMDSYNNVFYDSMHYFTNGTYMFINKISRYCILLYMFLFPI